MVVLTVECLAEMMADSMVVLLGKTTVAPLVVEKGILLVDQRVVLKGVLKVARLDASVNSWVVLKDAE